MTSDTNKALREATERISRKFVNQQHWSGSTRRIRIELADAIMEAFAQAQAKLEAEVMGALPVKLEQPQKYLREHTPTQIATTKAAIDGRNNAIDELRTKLQEVFKGKK